MECTITISIKIVIPYSEINSVPYHVPIINRRYARPHDTVATNKPVVTPGHHVATNKPLGRLGHHVATDKPPGKPGHHVATNKPPGKPGHHVAPNKPPGKPGHHVAPNKPPGKPDHHVEPNKIVPLLTCTFPTIPYQSHSTKSQDPFLKTIIFFSRWFTTSIHIPKIFKYNRLIHELSTTSKQLKC